MSLLPRACLTGKAPSSRALANRGAEGFRTFLTRADAAKMVVGVDACGMPVGKSNLNGVVAYRRGGFGARLGLVHGQHGRRGHSRRERLEGFFLAALVIARGARACIAQVGKIVVTGVAVGPDDVHTSAARQVNLDAGRLFSWIEGSGHGDCFPWSEVVKTCAFHRSKRQEEWDCHGDRSWDARETCKSARRARG